MIKVTISKNKIIVTGHALYDEYGQDIVCAAVSATVLCTINGILAIDETTINPNVKEGNVEINIIKENDTINKLIQNMINCLKSLEKQYKKNIIIKEE